MKKLPKSQDPANWRKGKDLQIGDMIAVKWDEDGKPIEFSPIESYEGKQPYMSVTNYVYRLANGRSCWCGGGEFKQGRFTPAS